LGPQAVRVLGNENTELLEHTGAGVAPEGRTAKAGIETAIANATAMEACCQSARRGGGRLFIKVAGKNEAAREGKSDRAGQCRSRVNREKSILRVEGARRFFCYVSEA
jgi:hypothetical protein